MRMDSSEPGCRELMEVGADSFMSFVPNIKGCIAAERSGASNYALG
jgi:hypothetical protein